MGLFKKFINQTARPEGILGRLMIRGMNCGHAKLADWGISTLGIGEPDEILDIGCGGGRHIHKMLRLYPGARGAAVDCSPLCVRKAAEYNRKEIRAERLAVDVGDAADLPFPAEKFDLVTAFETVYFWPGLVRCFTQAARVLKPDGVFLIVNETDGVEPVGRKFEKMIDRMTDYTAEELEEALRGAGFAHTAVSRHSVFPWIAVAARKHVPRP